MDHFISPQLIKFFKRFEISTEFLHINPELWSNNEEDLKGKKDVNRLRVVNDTAEKLVDECRAKFPGCSKASLSSTFTTMD